MKYSNDIYFTVNLEDYVGLEDLAKDIKLKKAEKV